MKPIAKEYVNIGNKKDDPFYETRVKEILDFWASCAQYAELEKSGEKTLAGEKNAYLYTIRKLAHAKKLAKYEVINNDIVIHTSRGRIIAERRQGWRKSDDRT